MKNILIFFPYFYFNMNNEKDLSTAFKITCMLVLFSLFSASGLSTLHSENIYQQNSTEIILVAGFEPWASHQINPSGMLATRLNGTIIDQKEVVGIVLPVDFNNALDTIINYIDQRQPVLVMCLGLAPGSSLIRVETVALNVFYDPYNPCFFQSIKRIDSSGPCVLLSSIAVESTVNVIQHANLSAEQSYFAGFYLCNALFYKSLHHLQNQKIDSSVGFIHVPQINSASDSNWTIEELLTAITLAIQENI